MAVDIVIHELAVKKRDTFLKAGEQQLLPYDLAELLADAAGLRNVLVHLYEEIDYHIVANSIDKALSRFRRVRQALQRPPGERREPLIAAGEGLERWRLGLGVCRQSPRQRSGYGLPARRWGPCRTRRIVALSTGTFVGGMADRALGYAELPCDLLGRSRFPATCEPPC